VSERHVAFRSFRFFTWTENIALNLCIILSTPLLIFKDYEQFLSKQRQEVFTFSKRPRPTLESIQPLVQLVQGSFPFVKVA
jgi:hypothetical protein